MFSLSQTMGKLRQLSFIRNLVYLSGSSSFHFIDGTVFLQNKPYMGIPWRSSGHDSALPLQGAWIRSLVGGTKILQATQCGQKKQFY